MAKNFNEEVNLQAKHMSQRVIAMAAERIEVVVEDEGNSQENLHRNIKIIHQNSSSDTELHNDEDVHIIREVNKEDEKIKFITKAEIQSSSFDSVDDNNVENQPHQVSKAVVLKEFNEIVQDLHRENSNKATHVKHLNKDFVFNFSDSNTKITSLMEEILLMIIVSAALALCFAYWLSHQFNKPLQALSLGFKKLASGDYHHHVGEQGVTEIRETIQHFNATKEKLEEFSKAEKKHQQIQQLAELGEVSQGLAHALRNPIHTIGLAIEQLNDESITAKTRTELISAVTAKIKHMNKTISALLQLTTAGLTRDQQVPIHAVIQDIILEYKASDDKQLNISCEGDENLIIKGSESEIRSILHTLIINACEASTLNGTVNISTTAVNNAVKVIVEDNGGGVEENIKEDLFKPHVTNKAEGSGMGLYIANRLINLNYNGKIKLTNSKTGCLASATFSSGDDNE
ncbi:ATP-binding protein [Thalassotalea nanhaiensis]|uniref:histidine kinase n=1 Tax=Thalassotalea nanhaiensis TaxID=3065648 RepID=A0ABY9TNA9_9GAMM|nr:ATP-binding protein [Colwelliaceae bacterium SQ345]